MKFMVVQPDYNDRVLVLDTDEPEQLEQLRKSLSGARYENPGDRFLFDSRPGDLCTIDYDRWIVRLGRDFSDDPQD